MTAADDRPWFHAALRLLDLRAHDRVLAIGCAADEVRALVDRGYGLDLRSLQSVGYRQMGAVFQGKMTLTEALEEMKQETRHLAKRQLTWFRRDAAIAWFHPERQAEEILEMASGFLDQ